MSSLNFIGGEKGGVGKSVVARLLAQYFIDKDWPFTGFDTDRSHTSFTRFYADYASPVVVDSYEGLDRIVSSFEPGDGASAAPQGAQHAFQQQDGYQDQFQGGYQAHFQGGSVEAAAAPPLPRVIVDLAAQTAAPLARWVHESDLIAVLNELGVKINLWHVSDGGQDSIDLLDRLLHTYGAGVNLIVVKNHGRGSDFSQLEASAPMREAFARGARVVGIGALQDASMGKIDRQNRSFWGAVHNRSGVDTLGMLERQRVKTWLKTSYEAFDSLPL